jgi:RNA polymerase sigma-70 factor (ECF subfamily)
MSEAPDDETCAARLAQGDPDALRILYARYVRTVFGMALSTLGEADAEEVVQATFATIWKNRGTYDRARGAFRPWLYQIARNRIANEVRRNKRKQSLERRAADQFDTREPLAIDDARVAELRRRAVRDAVDALPPAQARALSLTFFDELSHEQVASALGIPLGTAKTRIRGGMKRLAVTLATLVTAIAAAVGVRRGAHWIDVRDRALVVTTRSDVQPLRMGAMPGEPPGAHATFRARAGDDLAVVTASSMPPLRASEHYAQWMRRGSRWIRLGEIEPGADTRALAIFENPAVTPLPDALEITVETSANAASPAARVVVAWTR